MSRLITQSMLIVLRLCQKLESALMLCIVRRLLKMGGCSYVTASTPTDMALLGMPLLKRSTLYGMESDEDPCLRRTRWGGEI
jgi:hypothetical protein